MPQQWNLQSCGGGKKDCPKKRGGDMKKNRTLENEGCGTRRKSPRATPAHWLVERLPPRADSL
jgi:hypothetical protein